MILKGQKRKLTQEDVEVSDKSAPLWESQRQFVFSVSLNKYQRSQELPEPSLRRSVLIANTLRQVGLETCRTPPLDGEVSLPLLVPQETEREVTSAGARHQSVVPVDDAFTDPACCPVVSLNCFQNNAASRSLTSCHLSEANAPATAEEEDGDWGSMSTDSDFSLSAAISSILTALDSTMDVGPQAPQRTPLRSLENLSGPSEGGAASAKQEIRDYSWDHQGEAKVQGGIVEAVRTSHTEDVTMEDLFQDIDTSQLARDMGVLGLRSSGGGFSAADDLIRYIPPLSQSTFSSHPFSISLGSNLKCLPSFSSFSPLSSSLSPPGSASFSGQSQVREGLELEQLMEILVES
ncbi:SERTA domain-containing protein 2 [Nematolebias whitei]|uniref:SERTA domain-containing protein 2 n=1 Tax=Nematolebias whitei TaxID=451745 RepID=UPI0018991E67|nr:SERTA domain-containing protein 2 [Nematolebias whitei]